MKTFKPYLFTSLFFTLIVSCNFGNSKNNESWNLESGSSYDSQNLAKNTQSIQKGLKYNNIYDETNGLIMCQIPLPKSWKYNSKKDAELTITAPNNIKVNKSETQNYAYANDAFSMQTLQMANNPSIQISPVYSLQQILRNHIIPSAQSQGYRFIKSYPLPKVLAFWNRFESGMLKTGSQRQYHVLGTDWEDSNGNKSFIVLVQRIMSKGYFTHWTLITTELEAPQEYFKKAKEDFIYGLANTQINMEWQQYTNNELLKNNRQNQIYWENATRQSQIAHNQRMSAIASAGNSSRSVGKTYSDILDINHAGYLKRDNMNSVGQSKTINMIGERSVISSIATGERYNVEAGSKYYWVNNDAGYFGTDNSFYDPRTDRRVNNKEWHQFKVEN